MPEAQQHEMGMIDSFSQLYIYATYLSRRSLVCNGAIPRCLTLQTAMSS